MIAKLSMVTLGFIVLTGCSIGNSDFTCSAGDDNALCGSSRAVYKATSGEVAENDNITVVKDGERTVINANDFNRSTAIKSGSLDNHQGTSSFPYTYNFDGNAVRSDTEVMRIWLAPWVDKADDLHLSSLIYTDIEAKKWSVEAVNENNGRKSIKTYLGKNQSNVTTISNNLSAGDTPIIEKKSNILSK